jgi:hypothetical protein
VRFEQMCTMGQGLVAGEKFLNKGITYVSRLAVTEPLRVRTPL